MATASSKPSSAKAAPAKAAPPAADSRAAKAAPSADKKSAAALPDAALLDRDAGDTPAEGAAPPTPARSRYGLPTGPWRWAVVAAIFVVVAGGAGAAAYVGLQHRATPPTMPAVIAGPAQVVNGRMLVVGGQTIRLQAIDAPPATLICRDGAWEYKCGAESRKALEQLVGNRPVECEPSGKDDDAVHAVCHSDQGVDIAAALVASGWAVADLRRSSRYLPQQAKAQDQGLGLWRNNFAYPEQWRLAARGER